MNRISRWLFSIYTPAISQRASWCWRCFLMPRHIFTQLLYKCYFALTVHSCDLAPPLVYTVMKKIAPCSNLTLYAALCNQQTESLTINSWSASECELWYTSGSSGPPVVILHNITHTHTPALILQKLVRYSSCMAVLFHWDAPSEVNARARVTEGFKSCYWGKKGE